LHVLIFTSWMKLLPACFCAGPAFCNTRGHKVL
jgi:hypothetical protein